MTRLKLTTAQYLALQAAARREVYRTHTGSVYTLTGPCGSKALWALAQAGLIADPPDSKKQPRYPMVVTPTGMIALSAFVPKKKRLPCNQAIMPRPDRSRAAPTIQKRPVGIEGERRPHIARSKRSQH
ncbi:hypothetical protein [Bradyrhizobium sp. JYMT SZCCT0428]|uniref:hypothetical protein n=1 Tax=Bradyrhizobium sp. JYMT SZCCT0428 TaxID=2807673 RepID=UPI001BA68E3F|nr:hypothetical protein [Bradyrhizobium sp. JYMT SZCCT0428]MBR1157099.1 hypothetical protein [Bradyrhizobium sp. JYMT SZCCT0428]